jgi:hypothetical protein
MSVDVSLVRAWCLLRPRPAAVRCKLADGEEHDVAMREGASWAALAETITTLAPESLTAVDHNGKVIRAVQMAKFEGKSRDNKTPDIPAPLSTDPETARVTHFANLLHRAYQHTTEIAFEKMVALVDIMNARSDAIERRLERTERSYYQTLQDQLDDAFERAEEAGANAATQATTDPQAAIMQAFMSGMQGQKAATPARPNGKGTAKP